MQQKPISNTGLEVTSICFGAAALGNMPDTYGFPVDEELALKTIRSIFDSEVNFLDTSRNYGFGQSETRIGKVIKERGGLPAGFVLSTKLDRDMETNRFDASQVRRSLEESMKALNLDSIPLLHLHDPEYARDLQDVTKTGGSLDELFRMKEEGLAQAVGLAMGRLDIMIPLLSDYPFDALISHNRYTLLNRSANEMFDYAYDNGMAILNAAPYAGGIFAEGSNVFRKITYQDSTEESLEPVRTIEALCASHDTPAGAVALQFSLQDPRITSTIAGVAHPDQVAETLRWAGTNCPAELLSKLNELPFETGDPEANRNYKPG